MSLAAGHACENHVPHYDLYGHHHHREPFKDKSHILKEDIRHPKWLEPQQGVKSRGELMQARQKARVPDSTYDFDGDGVVGQLDHFVGRCFDKDNDGSLTRSERLRAKKALDDGFLNKYVRGLDSTGDAHRGCAVMQKRGVIVAADNTQDISAMTFGPHHNAHMQPPNNTRTALQLSRLAEARGAANVIADKYAAFCAPVTEPDPPNHRTDPRTCPVSHIRERAEADHQASRIRGGLLPMNTAVNPERELKTVGLEHVEKPLFATRGALLETRRAAKKRESEELALKALEVHIPSCVGKAEKQSLAYEFRRPDHVPMTLTRLKDQRRQDRIEYDMTNFQRKPREYPHFSDSPEVPFWKASGTDDDATEPARSKPSPSLSRSVSEPVMKVTDVPFEVKLRTLGPACPAAGKEAQAIGPSRIVKRWTAEMIERGEGRNKPRLFDSIQPVRVGPMDLQSLDLTSSMEPVRRAAIERLKGEQARNAMQPMTSRLWNDPSAKVDVTAALAGEETAGVPAPEPVRKQKKIRPTMQRNISSEPTLRHGGVFEKTEIQTEPRFFGNVSNMAMPLQQRAVRYGVRCGGFHRSVPGPGERSQPHKPTKAAKGGESGMM